MGSELLATYYFNHFIVHIHGCWCKETPEGEYDMYDLFDHDGNCLNENSPFHYGDGFPSRDLVRDFLAEVKGIEL